MISTKTTLRFIVSFITIGMLLLAGELYFEGNGLASVGVLAIGGAIVLESIIFEKGGAQINNRIK